MNQVWKKSAAIIGYIWGGIGTLITVLAIGRTVTIGIGWLILILLLLITVAVISVLAAFEYFNVKKNGIRYTITAYCKEKGQDMYYTSYSNNLRVETVVSIYYSKPFSKKLGLGIVNNICKGEYVEIKIIDVESDMKNIFESSKTNSKETLQDMYVLPNMYMDNVEKIKTVLDREGHKNG